MNKIDWSTFKFHPSSMKALMTNARKKDELLSETAKSFLRELWIEETFGREKLDQLGNKYMRKGTMCETDSLELYERVTGKKYFKNQKTFTNEFIIGTPDVAKGELIDIKTSWDIWTFATVDESQCRKDYYIQVLCYMWLKSFKKGTVVYALVNTPDTMIADELYRLSFKLDPDEDTEKYRCNYIFDDIPEKDRIKPFEFEYDEEIIEKIKERISFARDYLSEMTL